MRADRLLSLLMLLQTRGQMSASMLAEALEVSVRTIYRDIEALSNSGVPVYAEAGVRGGYRLLDSYRTSLTGLTDAEVRALFMLNIPGPLVELGMGESLRSALLKLAAALPSERRLDESQVRQRLYLDPTWDRLSPGKQPFLGRLQQAIWENRRIHITCQPLYSALIRQVVEPYGLVSAGGMWFLVCARQGEFRVWRVAEIRQLEVLEAQFIRAEAFDLRNYWDGWRSIYWQSRPVYRVVASILAELQPYLDNYFGSASGGRMIHAGMPDDDGWLEVELEFDTLQSARSRLLGLGAGVKVLAPEALKLSMADFAAQISTLYQE